MDYKILQIIPAPNNMYAVYKEFENRIVCLALIEDEYGDHEIVPMDMTDGDGGISRLENDLECIIFK